VPEPLSDGWLEAFAAELAEVDLAREGVGAVDGVAQILISSAPTEMTNSAAFYFEVNNGCLSVQLRRHRQPDMIISGNYQDFLLVWRGELSLEAAYMSGRMKLEGDQVLLFDRWRPMLRSQQLREAWQRLC